MQSRTVKDGYGFEVATAAGTSSEAGDGGAHISGCGPGPLYVTAVDSVDAQQKAIRRREKELISIGAKHLIAPNETA